MSEFIQPRQVKCPRCGLFCIYSTDNPFRPFCSERCRVIDLGAWANESYKIPVQAQNNPDENIADPEQEE